jgi:hypothetical protein
MSFQSMQGLSAGSHLQRSLFTARSKWKRRNYGNSFRQLNLINEPLSAATGSGGLGHPAYAFFWEPKWANR